MAIRRFLNRENGRTRRSAVGDSIEGLCVETVGALPAAADRPGGLVRFGTSLYYSNGSSWFGPLESGGGSGLTYSQAVSAVSLRV